MNNELLRHALSTIAYRLQKVVRYADDPFERFNAGNGVRTPAEIVNHMTHVLLFARYILLQEVEKPTRPAAVGWKEELQRLHGVLGEVDIFLVREELPLAAAKKLLQGPFADVLTHIGQITLLRRLAGGEVQGENFVAATITTGDVSAK